MVRNELEPQRQVPFTKLFIAHSRVIAVNLVGVCFNVGVQWKVLEDPFHDVRCEPHLPVSKWGVEIADTQVVPAVHYRGVAQKIQRTLRAGELNVEDNLAF